MILKSYWNSFWTYIIITLNFKVSLTCLPAGTFPECFLSLLHSVPGMSWSRNVQFPVFKTPGVYFWTFTYTNHADSIHHYNGFQGRIFFILLVTLKYRYLVIVTKLMRIKCHDCFISKVYNSIELWTRYFESNQNNYKIYIFKYFLHVLIIIIIW